LLLFDCGRVLGKVRWHKNLSLLIIHSHSASMNERVFTNFCIPNIPYFPWDINAFRGIADHAPNDLIGGRNEGSDKRYKGLEAGDQNHI